MEQILKQFLFITSTQKTLVCFNLVNLHDSYLVQKVYIYININRLLNAWLKTSKSKYAFFFNKTYNFLTPTKPINVILKSTLKKFDVTKAS